MAAIINSLYMSAVQQVLYSLKYLHLYVDTTSSEHRVNILLLTCVYLLHKAKYLQV